MSDIKESTAGSLIAAAAAGVAPCADWDQKVLDKALSLARFIPTVVERIELLETVQPVRGVIVRVEEVKGRGLVVTEATMGNLQRNQEQAPSGRGIEHFRTAWLNEPAGRALFDQATSLIGRHCRFGKRIEEGKDANGDALKVRMVEWIEDLGPDPLTVQGQTVTNAATPRQTPTPLRSAPPAANIPDGPIDPDAWFRDNGWRDKQEHDDLRKSVKSAKDNASEAVQAKWAAWSKSKGWNLNAAWPAEQALLLKSKLIAYMDEEEQAELVAAGGVPYDDPNDAPF